MGIFPASTTAFCGAGLQVKNNTKTAVKQAATIGYFELWFIVLNKDTHSVILN